MQELEHVQPQDPDRPRLHDTEWSNPDVISDDETHGDCDQGVPEDLMELHMALELKEAGVL